METLSIDILTKKLKNAPQSVLERVIGYADALLESQEDHSFVLSDDQKKILLKQNNVPLEDCTEAHLVYENLKNKYGL
ncbi:hypothetical protein [Flavobacterium nackdongense]|uniref:Uncharacterized protein n=1 Tax=Flavobacterium nackdongense TaxID=2547394 RepID=A0A4P6Y5V3_9FLAO|nr:hypothetical protein [Flavobacterium nackdongense]QBN17606.1 hypothetical protein E1750_01915 [Flavobacterium nackdongense]